MKNCDLCLCVKVALLFKQNVKPRPNQPNLTKKPSKVFMTYRYLGQEKSSISNKPFIDYTFMSQGSFKIHFLVQVMYAMYC